MPRHIIDWIDHPFRGVGDLTMASPFLDNSLTNKVGDLQIKSAFAPPMDLYNKKDRIRISLSLPGVKMEDLDVEYDEKSRLLSVSGTTSCETDKDSEGLQISERLCGDFERRVRIPSGENIDPDAISARLSHGVLELSLPKITDKEEPRTISLEHVAEKSQVALEPAPDSASAK